MSTARRLGGILVAGSAIGAILLWSKSVIAGATCKYTKYDGGVPKPVRDAFVERMAQTAQAMDFAKTGLPYGVLLAQASIESGWGASKLAQCNNNLFGIKGAGDGNPAWTLGKAKERIAGKTIWVPAKWANFSSYAGSIAKWNEKVILWGAHNVKDPARFVLYLWAYGWATDENYGWKILNQMSSLGYGVEVSPQVAALLQKHKQMLLAGATLTQRRNFVTSQVSLAGVASLGGGFLEWKA